MKTFTQFMTTAAIFAVACSTLAAEEQAVQIRTASGQAAMAYCGYAGQVPEEVDAADAAERLLILTPGGPLVVLLETTIDGKPFRSEREQMIDAWLKGADKDEDGETTWEEAVASTRFASGRFAYYIRNEKTREQFIKNYDRDKDGKLSRYECRVLLSAQFGGPAFTLVNNSYGYASAPPLFTLLDEDKNNELSADEIADAAHRLQSRDRNENDIIDAAELRRGDPRAVGGARIVRGVATPRQVMPLLGLLGRSLNAEQAYAALIARYGVDDKLPVERLALAPKLPVQLDKDEDGFVSKDELTALNEIEPHLHLRANFGETDQGAAGLNVVKVSDELGAAENILTTKGDVATLNLGGVKLEMLSTNAPPRTYNYANTAKAMLNRFDTDKNNYLEIKELGENRQAAYFQQQFKSWDEDGDGKVFAEEIAAGYERAQRPQSYRVSVAAANFGGSLFTAADANGDGRLGLRDVQTVTERIKAFDEDKDGKISRAEIPQTIRFAVARGPTAYTLLYPRGTQRVAIGQGGRPVSAESGGPEWFTRMDTNGDGDVTLKEFLGEQMQFDRLDTNRDGFIERAEAEAAEKP